MTTTKAGAHTQGRLKAKGNSLVQEVGRFRMSAHITACGAGGDMQQDVTASLANARRLAACWNFCEGTDTDVLEAYPNLMSNVRAERDRAVRELAAALELLNGALKVFDNDADEDIVYINIREFLKGQK